LKYIYHNVKCIKYIDYIMYNCNIFSYYLVNKNNNIKLNTKIIKEFMKEMIDFEKIYQNNNNW
jgi:hypothetical protein